MSKRNKLDIIFYMFIVIALCFILFKIPEAIEIENNNSIQQQIEFEQWRFNQGYND